MSAPKPEPAAELMSAYLDAELGDRESEAFEDFLEQDPAAKQELAELRQVVALMGKLPTVEAPEDFGDKVQRRLKRQRLVRAEGATISLLSVPFQVLSILVILAIAALYMMAQLEQDPAGALRKGAPPTADADGPDAGADAPDSGPAP